MGNAPGGEQRAESVVLYAPGKQREARLVARKFDVSNIEPVDAPSRGLAPQADVVLVIGAEQDPLTSLRSPLPLWRGRYGPRVSQPDFLDLSASAEPSRASAG